MNSVWKDPIQRTARTASGQDAPPTPTPVMCQTAATIYFARAVVNDIADKLRSQIDALRC
jgi:hypothetical protein